MKKLVLLMGLFTGLLTLFGCNNPKQNKDAGKDTKEKIETVNVNDILMSLPTIENSFPEFEERTAHNNLSILEDDWRQVEFISKTQKPLIDQEIDGIKYIFAHEVYQGKDYTAFKKLHVRQLIVNPISIPFDRLFKYLADNEAQVAGVAVDRNNGQVKDGFSLITNGITYYGLRNENNEVKTFGLYKAENQQALDKVVQKLEKFLLSENLYLVDWVQREVIDEKSVKGFLTHD